MEKDFHYYLTYAMAKQTAQVKPEVIAYASQFVDDNDSGPYQIKGESCDFPDKVKMNGSYYYPIMTQSYSPIMNLCVQKYVYAAFHFLPGDNNVVIKGKRNPFSTTPNSANAQKLLTAALAADNPYQLGIALHTLADTWSHQNFSGMEEEWNAVYPWYNPKSLITNVGHAELIHIPDIISEKWKDYRIDQEIDNRERALEAAKTIYLALQKASGQGTPWNQVAGDYQAVMHTAQYDARIARISDMLTNQGLGPIPDYSKNDWISRAFDLEIEDGDHKRKIKLLMKPDFLNSHWYQFHQAAKNQLALVLDLVKTL